MCRVNSGCIINKSNRQEDAYRFRTPSLRNVAPTAPYAHNSAYPTLEAIIRHHLNPQKSADTWHIAIASLPDISGSQRTNDALVRNNRLEMARQRDKIEIKPAALNDVEINALIAFMHTLTSSEATRERLGVPKAAPSDFIATLGGS